MLLQLFAATGSSWIAYRYCWDRFVGNMLLLDGTARCIPWRDALKIYMYAGSEFPSPAKVDLAAAHKRRCEVQKHLNYTNKY